MQNLWTAIASIAALIAAVWAIWAWFHDRVRSKRIAEIEEEKNKRIKDIEKQEKKLKEEKARHEKTVEEYRKTREIIHKKRDEKLTNIETRIQEIYDDLQNYKLSVEKNFVDKVEHNRTMERIEERLTEIQKTLMNQFGNTCKS